jgi:hypothetical protein
MEVFANFIGIITHLNGKYKRFLDGLPLLGKGLNIYKIMESGRLIGEGKIIVE